MTIKSLKLFNFESHKATSLDFDPGVNIITGLSGHGKSGIIRGFNWVISNSPSGESMISYSSEGICSSGIVFREDDKGITRSRGKKENQYYLTETNETFKALRGKVPEKVSTLANMDEVNVQRQKDFYFMLMDSPGQVAKMFNKVSGLEELDIALSTINLMYREKKKEFDSLVIRSEDLDQRLIDLNWINKADFDFIKIETLTDTVEEIEEEITTIENLLVSISQIQNEIDSCGDTSAIPRIDDIFSKEEECNDNEEEIENLEKLLEDYSQLKNHIKNIRLPEKGRINDLEALRQSNEDIKDEISEIYSLIQNIGIYKADITDTEETINIYQDNYNQILQDLGECPICGART